MFFPAFYLRALVVVAVVAIVPSLSGQTLRDTIPVKLTQHVRVTHVNGCQVYIVTIGTHPDPVGNGRDNDYTYFGTLQGSPRTFYYSPNPVSWTNVPDDVPGGQISYTVSRSSLVGPYCDYEAVGRSALVIAQLRQYAAYTTTLGVVAVMHAYGRDTMRVDFDGRSSYAITTNGHQPVKSYRWDFGNGETSSEPRLTVRYATPGIYYPSLTVTDSLGHTDTYLDTIDLTSGVLSLQTRMDVQRAGKRSVLAGSELIADVGDTITVVGTVKNIGMSPVLNLEARATFTFTFDLPDSLERATMQNAELVAVPEDEPAPAMRASLAPGDTVQLLRRYMVKKMATYRFNAGDSYADVPIRITPHPIEAVGLNAAGDTVKVTRPCAEAGPGEVPECDDAFIIIGPRAVLGAEDAEMPRLFALALPRPNPFSSTTTVVLDMPGPGTVTVEVFDAHGSRVGLLFDGQLQPGSHDLRLDAAGLSGGVYLVRARGSYGTCSRSVTLVR